MSNLPEELLFATEAINGDWGTNKNRSYAHLGTLRGKTSDRDLVFLDQEPVLEAIRRYR